MKVPQLLVCALLVLAPLLLAPVCGQSTNVATQADGGTVTTSSVTGSAGSIAVASNADSDFDGIPDSYDNCVDAWNPSQRNSVRSALEVCNGATPTPDFEATPVINFTTGTCANDASQSCLSDLDCTTGDACDCDLDGSSYCNADDFNLFLVDYQSGVPSGNGSDLDENGVVDAADYAIFEPLYADGLGGPGAVTAAVVDAGPAKGACYDEKWGRRLWAAEGRIPAPVDILDCSVSEDASEAFPIPPLIYQYVPVTRALLDAMSTNKNNPTEAFIQSEISAALSCPNAAFSIASKTAPRACDAHDLCLDHCGTKSDDCNRQFYRDLFNTCYALQGVEAIACGDTCLIYAKLYATAIATGVGGSFQPILAPPASDSPDPESAHDLDQDQANCQCRPATCETQSDCLTPPIRPRGTECDAGYCVQVYKNRDCTTDAECPDGYRCEPGSGDCWSDVRAFPPRVGAPPPVCGDGVCEPGLESCQASACPEDCGIVAPLRAGEGRCGVDDACLLDLDCAEGACLHGSCQRLAVDSICSEPNECKSASCDVLTKTCKSDCLVDGDCETGVCLLFSCVDPLPNGSVCDANSDCASDVCNFPTCVAANSVAPGGLCTTDEACTSGDCQAGFCAGTCGDFVCTLVPDAETCYANSCQFDCGACPNGTPCGSDADCASDFCTGVCFAAGTSPPGHVCVFDRECSSGDCQAGFCAGSCGDNVCTVVPDGETCYSAGCQNDCGKCPNLTPCTLNADCASGLCFALQCRNPFCGDGTCRGSESCSSCALDCGLCCAGAGTICLLDSACCSNDCGGFPPTCQ